MCRNSIRTCFAAYAALLALGYPNSEPYLVNSRQGITFFGAGNTHRGVKDDSENKTSERKATRVQIGTKYIHALMRKVILLMM